MYYTQKIVPKFYPLTKQISQFKCRPSCVINSILIAKECNAKSLSLSLNIYIYMYVCMYVCMYILNSPIRGEKAKTNGGDHDVDDPFRERERDEGLHFRNIVLKISYGRTFLA